MIFASGQQAAKEAIASVPLMPGLCAVIGWAAAILQDTGGGMC